jgi:phenylacetic acid degradation operon negative regulatory protein
VAATPSAFAVSRRHDGGAATARGLLLTVMGELMLPTGGTAWTGTVIDVLAGCGVEEKAARQALMRTSAAGWLTAERVGRRSRWRLTPAAVEMLTAGADRIFRFRGAVDDWDGRWLLVLARVAETERRARHLLRTRLSWAGFGALGSGLWISAHPERADEAAGVLAQVGLTDRAQVFVATRTPIGDPAALVTQAWDLDAVAADYADFVSRFANARAHTEPLTRLVALVHAWRRFPLIDPALPRELLPPRWSGARAADLFTRRHAQWSADAVVAWTALERSAD